MDFREIGKHRPRTKWGEGWVEERGKRRKVWVGFWYEYDPADDGERRRTREKVLGTVKEIGDSARAPWRNCVTCGPNSVAKERPQPPTPPSRNSGTDTVPSRRNAGPR